MDGVVVTRLPCDQVSCQVRAEACHVRSCGVPRRASDLSAHKAVYYCWSLSIQPNPMMIQTNPMFEWIRKLYVGHMYVSLLCSKMSVN